MESKIYPYTHDVQIHPTICEKAGGKIGLTKFIRTIFPNADKQWGWVDKVSTPFYSGFSESLTQRHIEYAAYDVFMLAMIMDNLNIVYSSSSDEERVIICQMTFHRSAAIKLGAPEKCRNGEHLQQHSLKSIAAELKQDDPQHRDWAFIDVGSGLTGEECAAQVALTKLTSTADHLANVEAIAPYDRLLAINPVNGGTLKPDNGVSLWQMQQYSFR